MLSWGGRGKLKNNTEGYRELTDLIEKLRSELHKMILRKEDLMDEEIQEKSRELDIALNQLLRLLGEGETSGETGHK